MYGRLSSFAHLVEVPKHDVLFLLSDHIPYEHVQLLAGHPLSRLVVVCVDCAPGQPSTNNVVLQQLQHTKKDDSTKIGEEKGPERSKELVIASVKSALEILGFL